ncbi:beta transducin [Tieghemiomyces parasiticus]|uniref:Beta transducin n=1 Tax=Tieghemiomyces parasiticus TaxID=78921 RepID=A0A9W8A9V1_9FUNG|nr:beta transducin [Tieghemiomyces parasiticus]
MGKTYLRYEPEGAFGVIVSQKANAVFDADGRCIIAPGLENVQIWSAKKGTLEATWSDPTNKAEITVLCRAPAGDRYAVGYANGAIRVFAAPSGELLVTFNGHRSSVSTLAFDRSGTTLVSGARDTHIILWNVLAESGICRLTGHKDEVTAVHFLYTRDGRATHVVSGSKDTLIKLWDLDTQHCVETLAEHRSEVWSLAVNPHQTRLVAGSSDRGLKVWRLHADRLDEGYLAGTADEPAAETAAPDAAPTPISGVFEYYGEVPRQSTERVSQLQFDSQGFYLACLPTTRNVELFRLYSEEILQKKLRRRLRHRRAKSKAKAKEQGENVAATGAETEAPPSVTAADEIVPYQVLRADAKVRSVDFQPPAPAHSRTRPTVPARLIHGKLNHGGDGDDDDDREASAYGPPSKTTDLSLLVATTNNQLAVYQIANPERVKEDPEARTPTLQYNVDLAGHRGEARAIALSSDDELLATASNGLLKVWNTQTMACIRTMACGPANCVEFLPGDKHIVIGTKTGHLELFDISANVLMESIAAHAKEVWSVAVQPDRRGLASGSADHTVKFWEFELVERPAESADSVLGAQRITLQHARTLEVGQSVLCVRFARSMKHLAVSLLDATVKTFFVDTLKYHLSFYGHSLPVLSLDISDDGALLATGSSDKNLKIWGMDFGDCHRSLFAHQDSVTCVRFVPETHYVFTSGRDKLVKYWDADKFTPIMKLEGHQAEVWGLVISRFGNWVFSTGQDRSIRVWVRTEEPLFPEEEKERDMEEEYESNLVHELERSQLTTNLEAPEDERGQSESTRATRQTVETLKAGERIMEALDLVEQERLALETYEMMKDKGPLAIPFPTKNPILVALGDLTPERYLLQVFEKVRPVEMEDALLVLPFSKATALFRYFDHWIQKSWNINLVCRVLFFLLRVHHQQISASQDLGIMLSNVRKHLRQHLETQKDAIGFNVAGLRYLREQHTANSIATYFGEEDIDAKLNYGLRKRRYLTISSK